jgi:hypothetical protein
MYCSIQLLGCGTKIIYALNLVAMVVVNVDLGGYTEDLDFTTWSKAPQRTRMFRTLIFFLPFRHISLSNDMLQVFINQ